MLFANLTSLIITTLWQFKASVTTFYGASFTCANDVGALLIWFTTGRRMIMHYYLTTIHVITYISTLLPDYSFYQENISNITQIVHILLLIGNNATKITGTTTTIVIIRS